MPTHGSRTQHTLHAERQSRRTWAAAGTGLIAAAWVAWFSSADVALVISSERGMIQVATAPTELVVSARGRLVRQLPPAGTAVRAGEVIATLDDPAATAAVSRTQSELAAATAATIALDAEITARELALHLDESVATNRERQARAAMAGARITSDHAARDRVRAAGSYLAGAISAEAHDLARTREQRQAAAAAEVAAEAMATRSELARGHQDRVVALAAARQMRAIAAGRRDAARLAAREAVDHVSRLTVRAPISGDFGSVAALRPGAMLEAGTFLATVLVPSSLVIRAEVDARVAAGRLVAGQRATFTLPAFPPLIQGHPSGRVLHVGEDPRDGRLQVELAIEHTGGLPLRHGMAADVEIVVDRTTPFMLALREAGLLLGSE